LKFLYTIYVQACDIYFEEVVFVDTRPPRAWHDRS
jgi:hypothetical protein